MGSLLHIEILEYLQQNQADSGLTDVKAAFEKHLDTMPGRKELKAELDYLLDNQLAISTNRFDFLSWELLTGPYPLDKKKLELAITNKGEDCLQLQTTPRFTTPDVSAFADETPAYDPHSLELPETVLRYPKPEENAPVPTAQVHVIQPGLGIANPKPLLLPDPKLVEHAIVVIPLAVQQLSVPVKRVPAPLTPQSMASREKPNGGMHTATGQDTEPVILTARSNRVFNKPVDATDPQFGPVPMPIPEKSRTLKSISDMPPGPVSLGSAPAVTKTAFKTREAKIFATDNSPFAALAVIPLAPNRGKEKKKTDSATLLRWAVVAVAFVLAILLYLIFKKRY